MSNKKDSIEVKLLKLKLASPYSFYTLIHSIYENVTIDRAICIFCGYKPERKAYNRLANVARRMEPDAIIEDFVNSRLDYGPLGIELMKLTEQMK